MRRNFIILFYIAIMATVMTACDDSDTPTVSSITGLWYAEYEKVVDGGYVDEWEIKPSPRASLQFNDDGTGYLRGESNSIFEIESHNGNKERFYWRLSGKVSSLKSTGGKKCGKSTPSQAIASR